MASLRMEYYIQQLVKTRVMNNGSRYIGATVLIMRHINITFLGHCCVHFIAGKPVHGTVEKEMTVPILN